MAESGGGAGLVDEAGDHVPVDALAVLSGQQQSVAVGDVGRAVVGDEFDQPRMQCTYLEYSRGLVSGRPVES